MKFEVIKNYISIKSDHYFIEMNYDGDVILTACCASEFNDRKQITFPEEHLNEIIKALVLFEKHISEKSEQIIEEI